MSLILASAEQRQQSDEGAGLHDHQPGDVTVRLADINTQGPKRVERGQAAFQTTDEATNPFRRAVVGPSRTFTSDGHFNSLGEQAIESEIEGIFYHRVAVVQIIPQLLFVTARRKRSLPIQSLAVLPDEVLGPLGDVRDVIH